MTSSSNRLLHTLSLGAAIATLLAAPPPRPAGACSLASNEPHSLDGAFAADTTPPGAVTATAVVSRHYEDDGGGCGGSTVATCGSYGLITLNLSASDDAAPAEQIGYQILVVDGEPPRDLHGIDGTVRGFVASMGASELFAYFSANDRDPFEMTLEIRAVDLNGNLGPPTQLVVSDDGD